MKRTRSLLCLALATTGATAQSGGINYDTLLASAIDRAQTELGKTVDIWEDHSTWDKAWVVQSEHYEVKTTDSYWLGLDIAQGLETMFGHFNNVLGTTFVPTDRFRVEIVDIATYNQRGDDAQNDNSGHHSSMYWSILDRDQSDPPVVAVLNSNPTLLRMAITHSAVHQFLDRAFPGSPPLWVDEGLASYFSTYWDQSWSVSEFERMRGSTGLVPLINLLRDPINSYHTNCHMRFMELGMFFHYLLHYREETRSGGGEDGTNAPFRDYLVETLRGQDTSGLESRWVMRDLRDIESELRSFEFPK